MEEAYLCIQPEYVERFQCDGRACDSACCRTKWQILLDDRTYRRYAEMEPSLRDSILSHICWNEDAGCYAIAVDGKACPFLQEDRLCSLQKTYGMEVLSDACAEYPRKTYRFPHMLERALCLTCPVAERLVLLEEKPMRFERTSLRSERGSYFLQEDDEERIRDICFFELQSEGIRILQKREWSVDQRLAVLGMFLHMADAFSAQGNGQAISELCRQYENGDAERQMISGCSGLPFDIAAYLTFQRGLLSHLEQHAEDEDEKTQEYLSAVKAVFPAEQELTVLAARYRERRTLLWQELGRSAPFLMEQYLVNEYFISLYPCAVAGSFADNFKVFAAFYKTLEFLLLSCWNGGNPTETALCLVRWISVRTNHFVGYTDLVRSYALQHIPDFPDWLLMLVESNTIDHRIPE